MKRLGRRLAALALVAWVVAVGMSGTAGATAPLATYGLSRGWATFGVAVPRGAAHEGLRVGKLETQVDVKTRWDDGSIRFALVTARVEEKGRYPISAGPGKAVTFAPRVPAAEITVTIGGEPYTARLPAAATGDRWLSGPLVAEWRCLLAPRDRTGHEHPFLRILLDVRVYRDGAARLDVTVENVSNLSGARRVLYDVRVSAAGAVLFEQAQVEHFYLTRWRRLFGLAGLEASSVVEDLGSAERAHALPEYLPLVTAETIVAEGPRFGILQPGVIDPYMPGHGGRPELAPYPDWAARYLVHKGEERKRLVLRQGDLAGSWPVHVREADGSLVSIDRRPQFWLDERAGPGDRPLGELSDRGPLVPDNAHQPTLAYIPYLLTGDRYYADEMAFWANYVLLATFQDRTYDARRGSAGLLGSNETRGLAWGLRNLVDAAAYLPDETHRLEKAMLRDKIANNLAWARQVAGEHRTPLGSFFEGQSPESVGTDRWEIPRPWQNNYLAWALDRAAKHGFTGGEELRDALARFQLALFTSPDYPREYAAPYRLVVGRLEEEQTVRFFDSFGEVFAATFGDPPEPPTEFGGYYGVDARLALIIAAQQGMPGAAKALRYLERILTAPAHWYADELVSDLALRAGWAIDPGEIGSD